MHDIRSRTLVNLVQTIMSEPLFQELRTRQQLGYSVSCDTPKFHNHTGFLVRIETQVSLAFLLWNSPPPTPPLLASFSPPSRLVEKVHIYAVLLIHLPRCRLRSIAQSMSISPSRRSCCSLQRFSAICQRKSLPSMPCFDFPFSLCSQPDDEEV